jgi:uncharacterized protein YqfA (UPF0365 family)
VVLLLVALPDLWFRALVSGTYVPLLKLFRIRIKRLDARLIVMNYIKARKSGVDVTVDQLETHVQAKGNLDNVVNACIAAVNGGIDLPIRVAMAIDLSGRDIKEAVRYTISPRVIETSVITAICKNGIELAVRAKITLKANLERLIGGVGEETVVARVSEGIVTLIGNTPTHTEFLEKTDVITKQLTDKTVSDEDAAFEVLSIDISKIEIGRNVGAELDIDLAESRKIVAQADAEQRRTDALAAEQEMRAITQEMRARVVAAEALLPQALAEALERGNISPTDYYKLDNLISDSQMRKKIAGSDQGDMLAPPRKKSKLA